jgi:hypothetical protein
MRLSEWRTVAPHASSVGGKVMAAVQPVLAGLGAEADPPCWVAWGDDPTARYVILAIGEGGLAVVHVRVNVPLEGPRAAGKLARWSRVQVGELSVETQGGHTLASFQVEGQPLRAVDAEAGRVTDFARDILAAIDGRPIPSLQPAPALSAPGDRS